MKPKIVYQDENLLAINKPSGWIVNEATTTKNKPVLQSWLKKNFDYEIAKSREFRSGIVHRLDKETSGILIVAKTKKAFRLLQREFKQRKVRKTYKALVHGKVEPRQGVIKLPVGRLPWNRQRFGVLPGGREAETSYQVETYYKKGKEAFSFLTLKPKTGRTHQIRIHLKHLKYPIVADEFYAGRKTAREDRKWCPRLFLHAFSIEFIHPQNGKNIKLEANLPEDLQQILSSLN